MGLSLSLKTKLLLLCAFQASVSIGVGGIAYWSSKKIAFTYEKVTQKVLPNVQNADGMFLSFRNVRIGLRSLGLQGLTKSQSDGFVRQVKNDMDDYEKYKKAYLAEPFLQGEVELWEKVDASWNSFKALGARVLQLHQSGTPQDLAAMNQIFFKDCPEAAEDYTKNFSSLISFHNNNGANWVKDSRETTSESSLLMMLTIGIGVGGGLLVGMFVAVSLTNSIRRVSQELSEGARQVEDAAGQISNSSQSLAQASSEQAASLEETVSTMEELTAMVKVNSENSKQAAALALSTRDVAIKGEAEIKTLIQSIHEISLDSKKIAEITSVIDDIAFQTNLLALNASVEAARAGEQGKGFAVVAEAVRNLAQRSADSAKSITALINGSVERILIGSEQANQGGVVLGEIVNAVKKVADLNKEMATASEEQSNGITQIGKAMNQLDQTTQQNAAVSEEAAAAAEELSAQSQSLLRNVDTLEKVVSGGVSEEDARRSSLVPASVKV
ncbi:methyl-accepting chemotaxis protein [Bdellovibrio sp. ArHS]|uniref:methyl-accepting chemotaxis protein n=1 Tax=Bdellovibrio sp. ArHS TaxID=1569284 RepID=UPI0025B7F204|nr:methyl-accepting chemotaxis protein [Bdellovibrio sp. ArHS]